MESSVTRAGAGREGNKWIMERRREAIMAELGHKTETQKDKPEQLVG